MNYYLLEQYLFNQGKTQKTVDSYLYHIRKFIDLNPNYKKYELKEINQHIAAQNEKYTREDGRVTGTVSGQFYAIRLLYMYLVHTRERNELPFPHSYRIKGTRTKGLNTKKLFTSEELDSLIQFVRNEKLRYKKLELRNQMIMSLLVYQALQCEDILRLKLEDIDMDKGTIQVHETANTNARMLWFHPTQFVLFHEYINTGRKELLGDLVDNHKLIIGARPLTEQVGGIGTFLRKYRLLFPHREMTAMAIRQSVIYKWLNEDKKPVETVQKWAGHKWPSATERYLAKINYDNVEEINNLHPMERI